MKEFGDFLRELLTPANITVVTAVAGIAWKATRYFLKQLNAHSEMVLKSIDDRIKDVEVEVLRLQILDGMDSNRLSTSELLYFFDKYKAVGGNSFVAEKVEEHLKKIKEVG